MKKICTVLRKYMEVEWQCQQKRHKEAIKKIRAELMNAGEAEKLRLIDQIQLTQSYLLFKKGTIPIRLTATNFPDVHPKVPLQKNGYDCGVFLLKYAAWFFEEHIKGNPIRITQKSVANQLNIDINEDIFRYSVGKALIKCINS
jgi:hypothetical protein